MHFLRSVISYRKNIYRIYNVTIITFLVGIINYRQLF